MLQSNPITETNAPSAPSLTSYRTILFRDAIVELMTKNSRQRRPSKPTRKHSIPPIDYKPSIIGKPRVAVAIALILSAILASLYLLHVQNSAFREAKRDNGTVYISANEACHRNRTTDICIFVTPLSTTTREAVTVITSITNISKSVYSTSFSCTNTEPTIVIDHKSHWTMVICGQAITEVELQPGETKRYTQRLIAQQIGAGSHTVSTAWGDNASPDITITLTDAAQSAPTN